MRNVDNKDRFEFRNSLWRNGVLAILCIPFALAAPLLGGWVGWTGAIFFGLYELRLLYGTLDRRIRVVINLEGVDDLRRKRGLVPWSEIASFTALDVKGNWMLGFTFRQGSQLISKDKITRWLVRRGWRPRFNVFLWGMSVRMRDLAPFIEGCIARNRADNNSEGSDDVHPLLSSAAVWSGSPTDAGNSSVNS